MADEPPSDSGWGATGPRQPPTPWPSLVDLVADFHELGMDPYPLMAEALRALGYTVVPPATDGRSA